MGQEKYEVWFAGIRGLGARKKYLLHEALKSCRNAYYIEETQLKKFPFLTEKDCQEIRQAQKRKDPEKICEEMKKKGIRIIPYYSEKYFKNNAYDDCNFYDSRFCCLCRGNTGFRSGSVNNEQRLDRNQ